MHAQLHDESEAPIARLLETLDSWAGEGCELGAEMVAAVWCGLVPPVEVSPAGAAALLEQACGLVGRWRVERAATPGRYRFARLATH